MADKIVITQSRLRLFEALAEGFAKEDQEKAEAAGSPFDYDAAFKKHRDTLIRAHAEQIAKEQRRDKAFQSVIRSLNPSPKMSSIIYEYIPDMKTFREISDEDFAKLHGVGKKTAEDFKKMRALANNPKVRVKLNEAIAATRSFYDFRDRHSDVIRTYTHLQRYVKTTDRKLAWVLRDYNG